MGQHSFTSPWIHKKLIFGWISFSWVCWKENKSWFIQLCWLRPHPLIPWTFCSVNRRGRGGGEGGWGEEDRPMPGFPWNWYGTVFVLFSSQLKGKNHYFLKVIRYQVRYRYLYLILCLDSASSPAAKRFRLSSASASKGQTSILSFFKSSPQSQGKMSPAAAAAAGASPVLKAPAPSSSSATASDVQAPVGGEDSDIRYIET